MTIEIKITGETRGRKPTQEEMQELVEAKIGRFFSSDEIGICVDWTFLVDEIETKVKP